MLDTILIIIILAMPVAMFGYVTWVLTKDDENPK
jgi:hypothetical protein